MSADPVVDVLKENGIRVELDDRNETLGGKIRDAQVEKVPYMVIIGDKEENAQKIAVRERSGKDAGQIAIDEFVSKIKKEIEEKTLD